MSALAAVWRASVLSSSTGLIMWWHTRGCTPGLLQLTKTKTKTKTSNEKMIQLTEIKIKTTIKKKTKTK